MKLSIIIVNYNVKYFLEQCLCSVEKAIKNLKTEVFIIDNNSVDGSCAMLKKKFPHFYLIENKENTGFSRANNQGISISKGEYILLLNPDTLVEEDTFEKIINFMDKTPYAGGLGVKMIDGNGNFLPESKRALPTPEVAFYKIFGLSSLFKNSKKFGRYHLSFLDKEKIHSVEILSGAFMMMRKKVLDEIGYLDETFFMYGEDIDLSYRIIKHGYKNYYFPETTIIHYKGESTKKGSINYVKVFYKAMIIFAEKHFSKKNIKIFSFLINIAIYFRAILSLIKRFFKNIFLPFLDALLLFWGIYFIKSYWEIYKFGEENSYPETFLKFSIPIYIFILLFFLYFHGSYKKPIKLRKTAKGLFTGTIFILIIYALIDESYRFSRAIILIASLWGMFASFFNRFLLSILNLKDFQLDFNKRKKIIIIGEEEESKIVKNILNQVTKKINLIGFVSLKSQKNSYFIANIKDIKEIINVHKIDEIIFCSKDISSKEIINNMLILSNFSVEYKIASAESLSIIGSNSIDTAGNLYVVNINSISKEENQRKKRILDIFISLFFILFLVFYIFFIKKPINFMENIFYVLINKISWVSYIEKKDLKIDNLPKIKKGVFSNFSIKKNKKLSLKKLELLNIIYAKNYNVWKDLYIIWKSLF
ncbi:MAG: hypothetical protein B6I24_05405 [Bacteroidetes bacterium 4572_128]|nr:MAG: hypothetical protein B6I24_05405 [Bacteroidetes bacterium 4572_128]